MSMVPFIRSIGGQIFAGFVVMGLMTGALGAYGYYSISSARRIVVDTYDKPLMAINFARSASLDFMQMTKEALHWQLVAEPDRAAAANKISALSNDFTDDLAIAQQRSQSNGAIAVIRQIRELAAQWTDLLKAATARQSVGTDQELYELADKIVERFDVLIELTADRAFKGRQESVTEVTRFQYLSIAATLFAFLLSALITLQLARRIVKPLSSAATVARKIADGELQTPIPQGGSDETGVLLRSMEVMQDSIRAMMKREMMQRQSAQNRLVDALESSREAMVLVDAGGKIVMANSQLAEFFPTVSTHLVEGTAFSMAFESIEQQLVAAGAPDSATSEQWVAAPTPLSSGGEFMLPDGRWVRISRSATQDGGFFLFVSDFTDIKQREENYKIAKRDAEAASAAKTAFLANMSHELRTPLNAVIGFSEIISTEAFGPSAQPRYVDYAKNILESGKHLLDIINSVLDLAKSEAGKFQLDATDVDLGEILDACGTMLTEECARAQLDFSIVPPQRPVTINGDRAKLRQIFLNLLSNAVKFTEPGGKVVLAVTHQEDGSVRVDVSDTGIGMREQDLPVAMAPFGQIDSRLARRYEGTGLGLPLTKALVELHGGTMAVHSVLGRGTTVSVMLACAGGRS